MATVKKFKLNKVVECEHLPGPEEGMLTIGSYNDLWQIVSAISYAIDENGARGDICIELYDLNKVYVYVFEGGLADYEGANQIGWYETDMEYEVLTPVDVNNITLSLCMDTEQPEDWDVENNGDWEPPFISEYFYEVLTEIVEEPKEPIEITYKIKRSTLVDIANAIREKTGKTDLIKVSDLDDAVKELSAGGGGGSADSGITLNDLLEGEW